MPALTTPPAAALYLKDMNARPLMEIASVVQIVITMVTAVRTFTALHVMPLSLHAIKFNLPIKFS